MARKIEITTRMGCKVACRYCPQQRALSRYFEPDKDRASEMSLEMFKKYLSRIPKDVHILFSGMCEPWLNPECTDMVEHAVERGHEVDVYTTLVGMNMEDYERIKKLKLHIFVLHAADKDQNAKIPLTDEYLKLLNAVVDGHISGECPITSISVHGDFAPEIEALMKRLEGVPVLKEIYDRAGNLEEKEGVTILVEEKKRGKLICSKCNGYALDDNYLLPDGSVLVCPMDWGLEYIIGNLNENSYEEIAEGELKQAFRAKMQSGEDEGLLCRSCHVAQSVPEYNREQFKQRMKGYLRGLLGRK